MPTHAIAPSVSQLSQFSDASQNDEVEIIDGDGDGDVTGGFNETDGLVPETTRDKSFDI